MIFKQPALLCLSFLIVLPSAFAEDEKAAPTVRTDRAELTLIGAQKIVDAALAKAAEMQLKVNISVVDDGGHLLAFARMDGARPGSIYTSMTKATTAALIRSETGPLPKNAETNTHLSLAVENAATASGGKFTTLKGGVPILHQGQVIGAIGIGGATGEQDQQIGRAAVEALNPSKKD